MNSQIFDILNRQEQEEKTAYQSETLLRSMICHDFVNSEGLLQLFDACGVGIVSLFRSLNFPELIHETVVPVRTGSTFSIHKHTLCQIPYFHTHDFYELIYVVRGSCRQEFQHLPEALVLHEKQACLLRPGVIHSVSRCGKLDVILKFTIPTDLFSKTAESIISKESGKGIYIFRANDAQVDFLIYRLLQENFYRNHFWDTAVENYLSLLFIAMARGPEYHSSELLLRLTEYFDTAPGSATLSGFASFIGYSEHHTARLIKRYTGQNFSNLIVSLKMERAGELLSTGDAAVSDIAAELGYANASGFHKQFLSAYGMTPGAYRRLFKQENGPLRK